MPYGSIKSPLLSYWGVDPRTLRHSGVFTRHTCSRKNTPILHRLMYRAILALIHTYICYAIREIFKARLTKTINWYDFNTLYNRHPVPPDRKSGLEPGIFYIGRVRPGCGVDVLIETVERINREGDSKIDLHVIGDGPLGEAIRRQAEGHDWLHYYGAVFDQERICDISLNCRFGCVPGFMGLNVVHMMSLSLPVMTHGRLDKHGPET
jgi:glycosyltransferase involved in cell wall biosynthesis